MIPLYLQARGAIPTSAWELVTASDHVTKAVLLLLAVLSLISWAVMFSVGRQIASASAGARRFHLDFDRTARLDEAGAAAKRDTAPVLPRLLLRGMHFVSDTRVANQQSRERLEADSAAPAAATLSGSQIETLHLILDAEAASERDRLGRFIPWLATIGSVSPLIGLLGTVLGVISAFIGIATEGSGSLTAVAPGVAQALIATAAALAVAIPATFGYNILANRLNRYESQLDGFSTALIARLVREGYI